MEIHVPEKPIHSLKDFLLHLVTITAGVLIALSLEGVREWMDHRSLVAEAKENLVREISENKRDLDRAVGRIEEERKQLQYALGWATELLVDKQSDRKHITLGTVLPSLTTASWQTPSGPGRLAT